MKELAKAIRQKLVGEFLRSSREEAGLTQLALARELGYTSAQFVSNWERGIAMPPMNMLPELSKLLHIPPKKMLEVMHRYQESFLALEKERLEKIFKTRFRSAEF
jgi:transcriptional regulator with XRE-family HTH domain